MRPSRAATKGSKRKLLSAAFVVPLTFPPFPPFPRVVESVSDWDTTEPIAVAEVPSVVLAPDRTEPEKSRLENRPPGFRSRDGDGFASRSSSSLLSYAPGPGVNDLYASPRGPVCTRSTFASGPPMLVPGSQEGESKEGRFRLRS